MTRRRVLVVCGTRPEVIKLAPVVHRLRAIEALDVQVCVTGQHRELLDQALAHFDLVPEHDLALMTPDQSLAEFSARALAGLDALMTRVAPALTFVQGDTSTAFIAALASYYRRAPVAHVEAGLRTGNKHSPFPEEISRRLIAPIADLHFAPTEAARANLLAESIPPRAVHVTGNTAIDALLYTIERRREQPVAVRTLDGRVIDESVLAGGRLILVTAHRRENHARPRRVRLRKRLQPRRLSEPQPGGELRARRVPQVLDSDDMIYPHGIEVMMRCLDAFLSAAFGLSDHARPGAPHPRLLTPAESYHEHFLERDLFRRAPGSAIIRRAAFNAVGGFTGKRQIGDHELWLTLARRLDLVTMPRDLVWDRSHGEQERVADTLGRRDALHREIALAALHAPDCPLEPPARARAERRLMDQQARNFLAMLVSSGGLRNAWRYRVESGLPVTAAAGYVARRLAARGS